jgi:hypothetical protein
MPAYVLKAGDSLVSVAKAHEFFDWHLIYDHDANADLRKKREHPNALCEGDTLFVPEKIKKPQVFATGARHEVKIVIGRGVWNLAFSVDKASCGTKVQLTGETNLPDGDLKLKLQARELPSPKLPAPTVKTKDGKFSYEWEIKDVQHLNADTPPKAFDQVHIEATTDDNAVACNVAVLAVDAVGTAPVQSFSEDRTWNGFSNRSRFRQGIEKFVNLVEAKPNVLKGWGGTYVDLRSAGITGKAGGCPWDGYRWARTSGMSMVPSQYYNGTAWVPLPAGFTPTASNYQGAGFYKTGTTFACTRGGTWPEDFADYDFNDTKYTNVRTTWSQQMHDQWTDKFWILREGCPSDKSVTCCRYKVEAALIFVEVTTYATGVLLLAPGNNRSNSGLWFMGSTSFNMPAHESGHLLDNPDEYAEGGFDATLSGDGAANGIDADCIMGANKTKTKKRHYHAIAEITGRLVKAVSGRVETYKAVDK